MYLEFRKDIYRCSYGSCSIEHNGVANIVHITIENEYGEPYEMALEWDQIDDLVNLCKEISVKRRKL